MIYKEYSKFDSIEHLWFNQHIDFFQEILDL